MKTKLKVLTAILEYGDLTDEDEETVREIYNDLASQTSNDEEVWLRCFTALTSRTGTVIIESAQVADSMLKLYKERWDK